MKLFSALLLAFALTFSDQAANADQTDEEAISAIVADIRNGWLNADGEPFWKHFLDFDGARYVESGGQNVGLTDLVENHVEPEGHHLQDFKLEFDNLQIHVEGEFAWALADVSVYAVVKSDNRTIDKTGYETFLFRKVEGTWKVVHTHSSTRPRRK
jgi:uncharacterized protein (TIGR02246 family)